MKIEIEIDFDKVRAFLTEQWGLGSEADIEVNDKYIKALETFITQLYIFKLVKDVNNVYTELENKREYKGYTWDELVQAYKDSLK